MAFADPARRTARGRTFDVDNWTPPWSFVEGLLTRDSCVKVAPGIPHDLVPHDVEAEWVSDHGEVKEAALWSGRLATTKRRATVIGDGGLATLTDEDDPGAPVRPVGEFLYEPDGAVIRAGLVTAVAAGVGGGLVDEHIAYVTADDSFRTPFARGYRVLEELPYREKQLRAALRERGVGRADDQEARGRHRSRAAAQAARPAWRAGGHAGADPGGRRRRRAPRGSVLTFHPLWGSLPDRRQRDDAGNRPEGTDMRSIASITAIVVGIVMAIAGVVTWVVVSTTLEDQKITVSDDANCAAGDNVNGPISAFCQADIIDHHTMDITGGKTYAELEQDDPNRETAMTSSFLQASLFTSVVAFGVALMAIAIGIVLTLIGFALRTPARAPAPTT